MTKILLAAILMSLAQNVKAQQNEECSTPAKAGVSYKVMIESEGAKASMLVLYMRDGKVLGQNPYDQSEVDVYMAHGLRRLDTKDFSVSFGQGQPSLIINETRESLPLICK